jgi:hypothetical protein
MDARQVRACAVLILFVFSRSILALSQTTETPGPGTSSSRQTRPSAKLPKQSASAESPDRGSVSDTVYRNSTFAITYKIPFGWVQRTDAMSDPTSKTAGSRALLAVFERPPEAAGDNVNSAVIITAESLSEYPGLDQAVDYFDVLDEITSSKGLKVLNPPYEFPVGTKKLARGDYSKKLSDDVTMYQACLVMLERGYVVLFTFIAGSEDELESLIMELKLGPAPKRPAAPKAK